MKIKTYIELEIEVEADYTPGRPAPMVKCHDDPGFSDPGDDESIEITGINFIVQDDDGNDKAIKVSEELMGFICDTVTDEVTEKCRDQYEFERDPMLYK